MSICPWGLFETENPDGLTMGNLRNFCRVCQNIFKKRFTGEGVDENGDSDVQFQGQPHKFRPSGNTELPKCLLKRSQSTYILQHYVETLIITGIKYIDRELLIHGRKNIFELAGCRIQSRSKRNRLLGR